MPANKTTKAVACPLFISTELCRHLGERSLTALPEPVLKVPRPHFPSALPPRLAPLLSLSGRFCPINALKSDDRRYYAWFGDHPPGFELPGVWLDRLKRPPVTAHRRRPGAPEHLDRSVRKITSTPHRWPPAPSLPTRTPPYFGSRRSGQRGR